MQDLRACRHDTQRLTRGRKISNVAGCSAAVDSPDKRQAPGACNASNSGIRVSAHRRSREVLFFHDEMQTNARWTGCQAGPRRRGPLRRLGSAHALAASDSMPIPPSTMTTASGASRYAQPLRVTRAVRRPIRPRTRCRCRFQQQAVDVVAGLAAFGDANQVEERLLPACQSSWIPACPGSTPKLRS